MTKNALEKRLKSALDKDNSILINRKDLATAKGFSEKYLNELGLRKADLKKLETIGGAIRGISKYADGTSRTAWILLGDTPDPADITGEFLADNKELMKEFADPEKHDV